MRKHPNPVIERARKRARMETIDEMRKAVVSLSESAVAVANEATTTLWWGGVDIGEERTKALKEAGA
jgi:hypothetical protein